MKNKVRNGISHGLFALVTNTAEQLIQLRVKIGKIIRKLGEKMELKIMTFNLRCDCGADGINNWVHRTDLVKEAIYGESPDIIGFQEVTRRMLEDVRGLIETDYAIFGAGRNADYTGEGVNIAFKKDKFDLLGLETFWLSDTPNVPGSRYESLDQSTCPRTALISELALRGKGKKLYFCNTHLDHLGEQAKIHGARLICEKLEAKCTDNDTVIITGDMNATPESGPIKEFCNSSLGTKDITDVNEATFHQWGTRLDESIKIDYIFTNAKKSDKPCKIVKEYEKDGVYCSDHYPVCAYVEI
ncbi:MAG: endonuclease/exonuclease/phosphatase family protein [Clostridia bacterium]|nr:endonuclease/exonuclease/phosphatase family protein [Clostridia bacterium]